ncbi:hypothetical protein Poli38472_007567 [Pythium oligandrum]|uniref:Uncharacterized protein n=1 Tax=Pythium oligandrum TaxID=41045 RepID=A0A8K1CSG3_PYTOL|nr:hypothetical protein Poli38472_007567 [Pythium oligandrum]|eukprot:TMW67895.1 hypothetical protein Poli38472_007567 [Pythium oligandrum]
MKSYATFDKVGLDEAHPHPYTQASWLSRALLSWVTPLLKLGHQKRLESDDFWPLQHEHQAKVISDSFTQDYSRSHSLSVSFFRLFGWRFLLTNVAFFLVTAGTLAGPFVLHQVVTALSTGDYDVQALVTMVFGLFGAQVVQALAENYALFETAVINMQLATAIKHTIYVKSLKLSNVSRREKTLGEIASLCTSDCGTITHVVTYLYQTWLIPLQIVIVCVVLYQLLGIASFAGFAVIIAALNINRFITARMCVFYVAWVTSKDSRMRRVVEAFKSISIVKLNAWEDKFRERIGGERAREVSSIWWYLTFNASSVVMLWGLPVFVSIVTFSVSTALLNQPLTPATVFTSITLFQLIQVPLRDVTLVVTNIIKARVAEDRIQSFLEMPELDENAVNSMEHRNPSQHHQQNVVIAIQNATFGWDTDSSVLRNVNFKVHTGEFVVIHGPVGCGKSSLCAALLGDMNKTSGNACVEGSVAYCSQQAWIQHMTVRDNILFGRPYDRKKYEKVLEACALTKDLRSLPAGDRTEIGERGVNLSGGQKARVALARACYSDASVFILDAPLSAVDAIVQNEIFHKCFLGLLRNRTIILVTHNPEIIGSEHVTMTVTIDGKGELVETRSKQTRPQHDSIISPLAEHEYTKSRFEDDFQASQSSLRVNTELLGADPSRNSASPPTRSRISPPEQDPVAEEHALVKQEERGDGRVGFRVFMAYYRAIGGFPVVLLVFGTQLMGQGFQVASDFWLGQWSSAASSEDAFSTDYRIGIYTLLGLSAVLMIVIRTLVFSWSCIRASTTLFDRMTYALMHAPLRFFDANPIGRILTRYSTDVATVDMTIPQRLNRFLGNLVILLFTMGTTAVIIQWRSVFLLPVVIIYVQVGSFYLEPARDIERIQKTADAPVLSHLSESIEGAAVIRAFGSHQVRRFHCMNDAKIDATNQVTYTQLCVSQWFALRIQLLGSMLGVIVTYSLVLLRDQLSAAIVGLAFSYVLKFSHSMERIVSSWSSVETIMVSPERMQQYIDIEQEAPHKIPTFDPPASTAWPSAGAIRFENVSFRYKDADQLVLKNLSFSVQGGEKIGIVGRTGAGKSSLTMALFRINELAGGSVLIDGVDVGKIGLKTLREKLSIIPQNPVLFKGPLRRYLDPFSEYSDDALWSSLRRVGLSDRITSEDDKLECMVEENGENFSVGERQMLCMCRALLRESRIVIFDEATAAIDHETDQKLQRVIREAFVGSTVLTIAHRLDTILDADRILVLDGGEVVSFACPSALVSAGSGHFYDLMREGGYLNKFKEQTKDM